MTTLDDIVRGVDHITTGIRRRYPDALGRLRQLRSMRTDDWTWPSWCWLPMGATHAYLTEHHGPISDLTVLHATTLWRLDRAVLLPCEQAIEDAFGEVTHASVSDLATWRALPTRVLSAAADRLPLWCPYIAVDTAEHLPYRGMWVYREHDVNTSRPELRFVIDTDGTCEGTVPLVLYLDRATLGRAVDDMIATADTVASGGLNSTGLPTSASHALAAQIYGVLPLLLASTAVGYTYAHDGHPLTPHPTGPLPRQTSIWRQARFGLRPL